MKQVFQHTGTGELSVLAVPAAALTSGCLLVKSRFSVISPGTERATVETADKRIVGEARARPDLGCVKWFRLLVNRASARRAAR